MRPSEKKWVHLVSDTVHTPSFPLLLPLALPAVFLTVVSLDGVFSAARAPPRPAYEPLPLPLPLNVCELLFGFK